MANIGSLLKQEMARVARKEMRGEISTLRKLLAQHRSHIAALRREIASLRGTLKRSSGQGSERADADDGQSDDRKLRFRASGFATLRKKLGLSAKDMGALLGVSGLSIYKWESGATHPRAKQLQAIAAIRGIGKREAAARIEKMKPKARKVATRKRPAK